MLKFLDKLKQVEVSRTRVIAPDLKRLNEVQKGLADKALSYVMSGDEETVLSTLSTKCSGSELEVCKSYLVQNSPSGPRRQMLAQENPYDLELAKRYTEVLSASCRDLPDCAAGSAKASRLVRVFFSEAFEGVKQKSNIWPPKPVKISANGLSLQTAKEMTALLGGTVVDFVDVLYNEKGRYGSITGDLYRKAVDIKPLAQQYTAEFIEAGRRIHATSRAKLIQDLHTFGLADTPEYRDFILELAGDSSKAVRETAGSVLSAFDGRTLEPMAVELLSRGNVKMRAGMVELLAKIGTDSALDALREHREKEKTARIISAIETALTVSNHSQSEASSKDTENQYQAIDGSIVDIPLLKPIPDGETPKFGDDDQNALLKAIQQENVRIKERNEENKRKGYGYRAKPIKERLAGQALSLFNADEPPKGDLKQQLNAFLTWGPGASWARSALLKLPQSKALRIAAAVSRTAQGALSPYAQGPFIDIVRDFISGPNGDIRHLEAIEIEMGTETWFGYGTNRPTRKMEQGDLLRSVIQDDYA